MSMSTPQPRSLVRPRVSLGNQTSSTNSTPTLATLPSQRAGFGSGTAYARKLSLGQSKWGKESNLADSSTSQSLNARQGSGFSPLHIEPSTPAMTKLATNHKAINGDELEVGDTVDVPGGMHGTVKFIGEVKGKKGIFAGVELSKEWAARGKNDGDVEG